MCIFIIYIQARVWTNTNRFCFCFFHGLTIFSCYNRTSTHFCWFSCWLTAATINTYDTHIKMLNSSHVPYCKERKQQLLLFSWWRRWSWRCPLFHFPLSLFVTSFFLLFCIHCRTFFLALLPSSIRPRTIQALIMAAKLLLLLLYHRVEWKTRMTTFKRRKERYARYVKMVFEKDIKYKKDGDGMVRLENEIGRKAIDIQYLDY